MLLKSIKTCRPVFVKSMTKPNLQSPPPPPSCKDCKWSIDNGNFCILFNLASDNKMFKSKDIRKNMNLCGPKGLYFRQVKKEIK